MADRGRRGRAARGFTLTEMVVVCVVLTILASVSLPVVKFTVKRSHEADLRLALRDMRNAIDEYKRYSDAGLIPVDLGADGYPKELDVLVKGVELVGQVDKKARFLRRIPIDPMTGKADWGVRSFGDEPDATQTDGTDVYDVYSLSGGVGLDGIPYGKW
jgi:general secretion pathway protein G